MINDYQGYFIDLDGTTYKGTERIPAAARFVERLQQAGKLVMFVTNNSTRTPAFVSNNLKKNHQINVGPDNVYTSALATADYLKNELATPEKKRVYMIGESGLAQSLRDKGFVITDDRPDFVVVGLDSHVQYHQFEVATLAIRSGAVFVGTNADSNLPNERGMVPGAGSLVELVRYATQVQPVMIGKPSPIIMEMALKKSGLQKDQVIMVGDNYKTDISAAINVGMDSMLVYTGLTKRRDLVHVKVRPTYELNSLDEWQ
ncbi:TIGR01457 family HAD-type hydrolase [uncultured Limosilactobacillus sp.]|uniref:TIGR01457 family HAD-type hydrolase n=1 Tax=uncultured Limosilactobacillus sp. TaxID=2837629 RepID=UPI0025D49326|nr:TIGR01457 family HAD-type hydrolase [uncultured Limosilactobacillus sp.]